MDINLGLLSIQNPWWDENTSITSLFSDCYKKKHFEFERIIFEILNTKASIYTLRGARGLGKSTIIKQAIRELIVKRKINPQNVFYYSCQNIDTYEQLNELIKTFLVFKKNEKDRSYIFIDEITLVKNWSKGIEYLIQAGKLNNSILVLAGSSFLDGRFKKVERLKKNINFSVDTINLIVSSLNFFDFINLLNPEFTKELMEGLGSPNIKKAKFIRHYKKFDYFLDIYFLTGGFLSTIVNFKKEGGVDGKIYNDHFLSLMGDLLKMNRDPSLLRQIMEQVIVNIGDPIGYKTIAKKTKAKTHLTVEEYLSIMESMFVLNLVHQSDSEGRIFKSKSKKVFFRDPFMFWLFYSYIYGAIDCWQFSRERLHRAEIFSALIENVIFSHLIKDETVENWGNRVSFWRNNIKKEEINFIVKSEKGLVPILVRYQKTDIENDDYVIFKSAGFENGIIITKDIFNINNNIKLIPLVYFLLYYKDFI